MDKPQVDFDIIRPYTILSENAEPEHWLKIIRAIQNRDLRAYHGIMITHGTDTLPYTAAALATDLIFPTSRCACFFQLCAR